MLPIETHAEIPVFERLPGAKTVLNGARRAFRPRSDNCDSKESKFGNQGNTFDESDHNLLLSN
jgi:hypothetical protein